MAINMIAKGSAWRLQVQRWAERFTDNVTVRSIGSAGDDIRLGDYRISLECKNHKAIDLAGFLDQAEANAPAGWLGIVSIKRRGKGQAGDAYAVMSMDTLEALLQRGQPSMVTATAISGWARPHG